MTAENLQHFLSLDDLDAGELELFQAVFHWTKAHPEAEVEDILNCIRFPVLSPEGKDLRVLIGHEIEDKLR